MNKKFAYLFLLLSSIWKERQAAVSAILKAGHIPAGMELFKAALSKVNGRL